MIAVAILGQDGRLHAGEVVEKMSATLMTTDCGAAGLRVVGSGAEFAVYSENRVCRACFGAVDD